MRELGPMADWEAREDIFDFEVVIFSCSWLGADFGASG